MIEGLPAAGDHAGWMALAIAEGRKGTFAVRPNPPVGALLVSDAGELLGAGHHAVCGGPHAEPGALAAAGERARGATCYVTLEPCGHHGRTPPCADALIAAGVRRVVIGAADPGPGAGGADTLRRAGVEVIDGVLEAEARALAAPFLSTISRRRPYVILKWAASLDGKLATASGASKWISGPASRGRVHDLRELVDAVAVGAGTARADDPLLTARQADGSLRARQPALRVVIGGGGRLPAGSALAADASPERPALLVSGRASETEAAPERPGLERVTFAGPEGRVALAPLLAELAARGVGSLLVEGGAALAGQLVADGLVDATLAFVAPLLIGGAAAPGPVGDPGVSALEQAPRPPLRLLERCGEDAMLLASDELPWDALTRVLTGAWEGAPPPG